jgi:AraC-like DNA-binding protein
MLVRLRTPSPPLSHFVENLWFYRDLEVNHTKERLIPDGAMELIIDLTESPKKLYSRRDPTRYTHYRRAWISGMHREFIVIGAECGSSMMGAHFRTGGAGPFFGFPLSELSGLVVELDLIWKREILALREQLLETPNIERKFALLERYLLGKAISRIATDDAVNAALGRLRTWPVVSLKGLASELGLSQKQMISRFDTRVGFTPKVVSRLFRFHRALLAVHGANGKPMDWSDLALESGYYDQAHFIHEFQEFAGVTPTVYAARRTEYPFYLYLD